MTAEETHDEGAPERQRPLEWHKRVEKGAHLIVRVGDQPIRFGIPIVDPGFSSMLAIVRPPQGVDAVAAVVPASLEVRHMELLGGRKGNQCRIGHQTTPEFGLSRHWPSEGAIELSVTNGKEILISNLSSDIDPTVEVPEGSYVGYARPLKHHPKPA